MTRWLLLLLLWACAGADDSGSDPPSTDETGSASTSDTETDDTGTTDHPTECSEELQVGTGAVAFEEIGDELTLVYGNQGGYHIVSSARLCDLGNDVMLSFTATRTRDESLVGGSGPISRLLLPDGPCCYYTTDVYTYISLASDAVPDALHGEEVRLDLEATFPSGEVLVDSARAVIQVPEPVER